MSDGEGREGFLGRWSRRKRAEPEVREEEDVKTAQVLSEERARLAPQPAPVAPVDVPADLPAVDTLTPESDYTRFMKPDVPIASRNAAMKKLFTDPHFNVMDGLDIYIDDYTKEDPIPLSMLRDLAQSKMLGLFKEEEAAEEQARQELADQTAAAQHGASAEADEIPAAGATLESAADADLSSVSAPAADAVSPALAAAEPGALLKLTPADAKPAEPYNPAAPNDPFASPASTSDSSSTVGRPDSA
jgi:Protein of unknown function (DUF3306)